MRSCSGYLSGNFSYYKKLPGFWEMNPRTFGLPSSLISLKYSAKLPYYIYFGLRQSLDANLVIGSPYGNFFEKEKFPKFYYTDYLRSLTYWIVRNVFQVSFGFVIISTIEIICRKYFQLRKIANRTKRNTFFDIWKHIPNPHYTRLKFLADIY